jgi:parallel beta-helix repeat protein
MGRWRKALLAVVLAESVFLASVAVYSVAVSEPELYDRLPVLIDGDANFTSENGVTGGTGTSGDPYVIEGGTIDGSLGNGVEVRNTNAHFVVRGVTVRSDMPPGSSLGSSMNPPWDGGCGVFLCNTSNGVVESCILTDNEYGIFVEGSTDTVLRQNNISEAAETNVGCGIIISHSLRARVEGNTFQNNGIVFEGTLLEHFNSHDLPESNTVGGRPLEYIKDSSGWGRAGYEAGQFIAVNCSDFTVSDVSVRHTDIGILIAFCQNFTIWKVDAERCLRANILMKNCSDGTVSECSISESIEDDGVKIVGSQGICIEECLFRDNRWYNLNVEDCADCCVTRCWIGCQRGLGIYLRNSCNITSCMNNVSTPTWAILLVNCSDSKVVENTVTSAATGLSLSYASSDLTVALNTFYLCDLGISIKEDVTDVSITGNNFLNNTEDVEVHPDTNVSWNGTYPEGGNFWSGLDGMDLFSGEGQDASGADGMADSPYEPLENVTDWYPLMAPAGWHLTRPLAHVTLGVDLIAPNLIFRVHAKTSWDFSDSADDLQVQWDLDDDGSWDTEWCGANTTLEHMLSAGDDGVALVRAMDADGYVAESRVLFPFDDEPPQVFMRLDAELEYSPDDRGDASAVIQWWATDRMGLWEDESSIGSDAVQIILDGRDISDGGLDYSCVTVGDADDQSGYLTFFGLSTGRHDVRVVCWDGAGNEAVVEESFVVSPDILQTAGGRILMVCAGALLIGAVTATVVMLAGGRRPPEAPPAPKDDGAPPGETP